MFDRVSLSARAASIAAGLGLQDYRDSLPTGVYIGITEWLRSEDPGKRADFLRQFFGRTGGESQDYFPNGNDLADYMGRILTVPWYSPTRKYDKGDLKGQAKAINDCFRIPGNPDLLITDDIRAARGASRDNEWIVAQRMAEDTAWAAAWDAARDAAQEAARDDILHATMIVTYDAIWNATHDAARGTARAVARDASLDAPLDAANGASYIIAEDLPELNGRYPVNPSGKLIDVYEMGLWPAGFTRERSVFWHPPVRKTG